jgi:phage repressor protein C with HTH and peptisase S24 domain
MLKHPQVWRAIDRLAQEHGYSASGLARRAGLDPTTFNKSKRVTRDGKLRWPSTESISKVLAATGATLGEFVSYVGEGEEQGVYRNLPFLSMSQAAAEGLFDMSGHPMGGRWDEIPFPELGDAHAYALEVSGESLEPVYRDGHILIVSPQAGIRRGDRVVVRTHRGEVLAMELRRRSARRIELEPFNPNFEERILNVEEVAWIARIVWVSQ